MNDHDRSFVAALLQTHYGITPISIAGLQQPAIDGRGIWQIAADGCRYVLRMIRGDAGSWLDQPVRVLRFLENARFPAPRVRLSVRGERIVTHGAWRALLIDFVDGPLATPSPPLLHRLATTTGRLHRLAPPAAATALPQSWKAPQNAIPTALEALEQVRSGLPADLDAIAGELQATLGAIHERRDELPRCIVHGDCWHNNAVQRADGEIVLIDWDGAGWGTPLIDLGELLLTCQYDLPQPTGIDVDANRITAILDGYDARATLTQPERALLLPAIRYTLAFHAADWLPNPQVWPKFVARFNATRSIAKVADRVLGI